VVAPGCATGAWLQERLGGAPVGGAGSESGGRGGGRSTRGRVRPPPGSLSVKATAPLLDDWKLPAPSGLYQLLGV